MCIRDLLQDRESCQPLILVIAERLDHSLDSASSRKVAILVRSQLTDSAFGYSRILQALSVLHNITTARSAPLVGLHRFELAVPLLCTSLEPPSDARSQPA